VYFLCFLLFLLAGSMILGIIRKLRGGSFLPPPGPGEDRHILDKHGRWWRERPDGTLEEAFRRSPSTPPLYKTLPKVVIVFQVYCIRALAVIVVAILVVGDIAWLVTTAAGKGIPPSILWVVGIVGSSGR
jgi:hypothetical protein